MNISQIASDCDLFIILKLTLFSKSVANDVENLLLLKLYDCIKNQI